ncbi:MAG: hypothetical protein R3325_12135 [Thermoanaerobaculia bacterium]|nr:hypothetical protein [Thermoanaerobaculia bacterium]
MRDHGARTAVLTLLLLAFPAAGRSEEEPAAADPLDALIEQNTHRLEWRDDGPSGPGWERIVSEGRAAEFFLIGESHGNRETPRLTVALAKALRPAGYSALGVEVGPITARRLVELCRSGEGVEAFRAFLEEFAFSFPYFWWREEAEMLCRILDEGYEVWGLDQEFIGSARFLLGDLRALVEDPDHRAQVDAWLAEADAARAAAEEGGKMDGLFIQTVDPEALRAFADRLPAEAERAREIARELAATAVVYQHYGAQRYFENNRDRVRLIKRYFRQALAGSAAGDGAKAIIKMGSVHSGRGRSPMMQLDIGNTASELAALRGGDSFHLVFFTRRSVAADGSESDWAEEAPALAMLDAHRPEGAWALFDLRPLRSHFASSKRREQNPDLADYVFRYDALLLADRFHAAETLVPLP